MRVLLVDDSPAQRKLAQRQLEDARFRVIAAESAEEALSILSEANPDVVVTDVLMPGMDGFELCSRIRTSEATAQLPVVLISAYHDESDLVLAKQAGASAFVPRGITSGDLVAVTLEVTAAGLAPKPSEALQIGQAATSQRLIQKLERYAASRHAVEEELRASEARFHELVDAVTDYAIFRLDASGHVTTWNSGATKNKGYAEHEIIGRHFSVFYTPEDRAAGKPEHILETVRREGRVEDESWRVRKDGTRFWANVVITALHGENGEITGFAKVTRDLTAKRAAEEAEKKFIREQAARAVAEASRQELEQASRVKDEFLATMSHELRTPLNAITGWTSLLRHKPREESKVDRGLEVIERNVKSLTRLVSDLLDVSRIINGKLQLLVAKTDVLPLIVAAAEVVRPAAEGKGVRLVVDVDPDIGAAMADGDRIQQIVWNLLTNAIRFTPRGGRVTVTGDRTNSGIRICVRDTGAGIAAEHLPHIFERFKQVDSSTTRAHGGLGLGLSIVRHLVEAHGGTAEAHSEGLGHGALFIVTLPIRALNSEVPARDSAPGSMNIKTATAAASDPIPSIQGLRILVVDDDLDSLEVLRHVLERFGANVATASSAREAIGTLEAAGDFELIISDVGMPEVDGYTFIQHVRASQASARVPAIALTAYARASDAEAAKRAGFQEHLAKPAEEEQLLRAVMAWARVRLEAPAGK